MSITPDDLLAQHVRQRQALDALRVCIAALGEIVPPALVAQEAELAAALLATEAKLQASEVMQSDTRGGNVARCEEDRLHGALVNGGTFYGTVIGYQENQASPVSPWACYQCAADNPPNTSFCFKCSAQLLRVCPECSKNTSMVASKICGNCGYHADVAIKRNELRGQIETHKHRLNELQLHHNRLPLSGSIDINTRRIIFLIVFGFCVMPAIKDVAVAGVVITLMFIVTSLTIVAMKTRDRLRCEKVKMESHAKIHQVEQEIIQYQQTLNETTMRKI